MGLDLDNGLENDMESMDHDINNRPKNGLLAGSGFQARHHHEYV